LSARFLRRLRLKMMQVFFSKVLYLYLHFGLQTGFPAYNGTDFRQQST
jgi:hypothetical protein